MGCGGSGKGSACKGISKAKGKGQQNVGKGGSKGGGMRSQDTGSMSNVQPQKGFARLEEQLKQVLVGSRPKAGLWTRSTCGDDKCLFNMFSRAR